MILAGGGVWKGLAHAVAAITIPHTRAMARNLVKLQHRHEGLLRNLHEAHPFHTSLAFLLLLQQFAFARHVSAVALRQHVLAHRGNGFAGDHLTAKDRKSTRLNSSHRCISYAVFCLKKKKQYT